MNYIALSVIVYDAEYSFEIFDIMNKLDLLMF